MHGQAHLPSWRSISWKRCRYLITPHSLKRDDLALMQELCRVVPIIPVLAKVHLRVLLLHVCGQQPRGSGLLSAWQLSPTRMHACLRTQADAMTADELAAFRGRVRERLCNPEHPLAHAFAEEDLAACGIAPGSAPPFAVIASAELDRSVGRCPPVLQPMLKGDHHTIRALCA